MVIAAVNLHEFHQQAQVMAEFGRHVMGIYRADGRRALIQVNRSGRLASGLAAACRPPSRQPAARIVPIGYNDGERSLTIGADRYRPDG